MTLDLDKRQRAMLREMGVQVWQRDTPPAAEAAAPAVTGFAINNGAGDAGTAGAAARLDAESARPAPVAVRTAPTSAPPLAIRPVAPVAAPAAVHALQPRPHTESMDWATLQTAVAGCRACPLCESRRNTVFGVGPTLPGSAAAPQVDWLIVGEAPGENEDAAGEPFVGQAGKLLDNMLHAIRLQRGVAPPRVGVSNSVFITNVLKCRPPANRNPEPAEVAQCEPYLKRQVELLQPKVIIAMGKFAAQSLLQASLPEVQKTPLGKLRGQVHTYLGVPVVVTYHPAYLLRTLADKAKAWDDLCLAVRLKT
jgi:uracil-DNA glycosylase